MSNYSTPKTAVLALSLIFAASFAHAEPVRVIDGDGFSLGGREVRLWGIDAPELTQRCESREGGSYPCGEVAKRILGQFLAVFPPKCKTLYADRYGRDVSRCTIGADDLGGLMVQSGWAVDYERFSDGTYADDQDAAQADKRGMWAGSFSMPWDWRRER